MPTLNVYVQIYMNKKITQNLLKVQIFLFFLEASSMYQCDKETNFVYKTWIKKVFLLFMYIYIYIYTYIYIYIYIYIYSYILYIHFIYIISFIVTLNSQLNSSNVVKVVCFY